MGLLRRSRSGTAAKSARAPARSAAARKKTLFKRLPWELRILIVAAIYLGLPIGFLISCAFAFFSAAIPDPIQLRRKESAPVVRVLARDGSLLGGRGGDGSYVPIDFLPPHLIDAVVATEDRRFFEHWGVDLAGADARPFNQPARWPLGAGRLDDFPTARQEPLPRPRAHPDAQGR